jgi:ATP-dependent Clp protease protease subunit
VEVIAEALERDNFMTAESAKRFGLIDKVITKRELPDTEKRSD